MTKPNFKLAIMAGGVAMALAGTAAEASHFRGGALIPTVSAGGVLTVSSTTFWRPSAVNQLAVSVGGVGSNAGIYAADDTSDSRFTKASGTHTFQLTGAGTYAISMSSCCRVSGIQNFVGSSSTSWTMNSSIFWNGSSASAPILFNFSNVQPEVLRGANYNGNLGALGGAGLTLSYDQALNAPIASQPPGFTINAATGALNISAANTATYVDNPTSNIGADYSFSGNIFARDGSGALQGQVEFEWLFDAVNTSSNNAPTVNDLIINALIGDTVNATVTATDDGLPSGLINWVDIGLLGGLGTCTNAPSFNTGTQAFSWNTAGCTAGTYIYQVQASDTLLTDFGTITVNLGQRQGVPEPATLSLFGLGVLALGAFARRRKS
ncbi:MAG: PEP-CTERM sorting domain-containing protein [Burkholderiales bacterium]|nr:PEP-CTERM sorting domain-containing protein [Burkholderiales bacterium]